LRFAACVDADDEGGDEPFVVAALFGVGVVAYDGGVQGVDERGERGFAVGRLAEGADDRERGAHSGESLALYVSCQHPGSPGRGDDVVDVAAHEPVLLHGFVDAVDQDVVGDEGKRVQDVPLHGRSGGAQPEHLVLAFDTNLVC
jgi:hypothetical protein